MNEFLKQSIICTTFLVLASSMVAQTGLVWPGDANNNGEVNSFDLLYLGYAYGEQGVVRPNATTIWQAETAPLWGVTYPLNLVDLAHADCDGSGTVDNLDVTVLNQNYGLTHTVVPDVLLTGTPGIDPTVEIKRTVSDTLTPGASEIFEIHLGPGHINNFHGISFTINYDTAYVESVDNFFPAVGWITNNGQDTIIQVAHDYLEPNPTNALNGRIDVAYSRINKQNVFGSGFIGLFSITMEENVSGKTGSLPVNFEFEVTNIRMVDADLNLIPTVPSVSDFIIITNNQSPIIEDASLIVYPNPAQDICRITSENLEINHLEIIDLNGRTIQSGIIDSQEFEIQLYDLPKGIYILKFNTPKGIIVRKLMVSF